MKKEKRARATRKLVPTLLAIRFKRAQDQGNLCAQEHQGNLCGPSQHSPYKSIPILRKNHSYERERKRAHEHLTASHWTWACSILALSNGRHEEWDAISLILHFWLKPLPVQTCAVFFPFTSVSGFVLSKCLQPSFVVSHLFSWQVRATEQMCLYLRHQPPLRIGPNGSLLDLKGTGYRAPGSSNDNRKTRRRLDTFLSPEDEHARSAVLLRFPCEQYHSGITTWINNLWENQTFQSLLNPSEFIAKQVPCRPDSISKQEPSVRTLWPGIKMMASATKSSLFWC